MILREEVPVYWYFTFSGLNLVSSRNGFLPAETLLDFCLHCTSEGSFNVFALISIPQSSAAAACLQ